MELTREQIEKMEAGRELDAMVAEQVMGWKAHGDDWIDSKLIPVESRGEWEPWQPSRRIEDAWTIIKHLCPTANLSESWFKLYTSSGKWMANFHRGAGDVAAETAPLAISRASLLATLEAK